MRENHGCLAWLPSGSLYSKRVLVFILRKSVTMNRKGIPDVPRRHLNQPILVSTARLLRSWRPVIAFVLLDVEDKRLITPIMESLKSKDKSFTIQTHGYSHETRPVLDCTRVQVSPCGTLLRFHRRLPMIIGFSETIDSRSYLCKLAII